MKIIQSTPFQTLPEIGDLTNDPIQHVRVIMDMSVDEYQELEQKLKDAFYHCQERGNIFEEYPDSCQCPACGEKILPF